MRLLALASLLLAAACGGSSQTDQLRNAVRNEPPPDPRGSVVVRFPGQRATDARPYTLPSLRDVDWRFRTPGLVAARVVGFSAEDDRIWALTPDGHLVMLDLETGRSRTMDSLVAHVRLDPRGSPIVITNTGTMRHWRSRAPRVIADSLTGTVEALHGTVDGRVLVVTRLAGDRRLKTLEAGARIPDGMAIPNGPVAFGLWGDVVAIATDSGLWVRERNQRDGTRFHAGPHAQALVFSASAHRLYVARGRQVEALDRYDLVRLQSVRLPGEPSELRADPWGRLLLARHPDADSLWIMPVEGGTISTVPGRWDDELPAVSPDGTILTRVGNDLVAWDASGVERGRQPGAGNDRWAVAEWDPRRPELQIAAEATAAAEAPVGSDARLYVQVSSTTNPTWAEDLARDLRQAGLRASVFPPTSTEQMYRVVVGPFASREAAETTGRTLGMPFWIFQPDEIPGGP
jgi:hypothetical protein